MTPLCHLSANQVWQLGTRQCLRQSRSRIGFRGHYGLRSFFYPPAHSLTGDGVYRVTASVSVHAQWFRMRVGDGIMTATSWLLRSLRSSIAQVGWNALRRLWRRPAACAMPCNTAPGTETSPLKPPVPGSAGLWLVNALRHRTGTWTQ